MVSNGDLWVLQILSYFGESLTVILPTAGLVYALMWLRDAGVSARLAVAGFGIYLAVVVSKWAWFVFISGQINSATDSTSSDHYFWPWIAHMAFSSLGTLTAGVLLFAALVSAWRRHRTYVHAERPK